MMAAVLEQTEDGDQDHSESDQGGQRIVSFRRELDEENPYGVTDSWLYAG